MQVKLVVGLLLVSICCGCLYERDENTTWHYGQGTNGVTPYFWWKVNENCGHGSTEDLQSPVDLTNTLYNANFSSLSLSYPFLLSGTALNNGHTINFLADDGSNFIINNGPFGNDSYSLIGFHFHWGESEPGNDSLGSEHSIDGNKRTAEVHFTHANTKYDLSDITNHPDGMAVISILLQVDLLAVNSYAPVFDVISQLPYPDSNPVSFDIGLGSLFPSNLEYYYYPGSVTTPGCSQAVQWVVLRDYIPITHLQLNTLFSLSYFENDQEISLGPNNRPSQPLNGRIIYRNFLLEGEVASMATSFLTPIGLIVVFLVAML